MQQSPTSATGAELSPAIKTLLARLRRRIRLYVWIEGIAAALAVLGIAFWVGLALDWLLEPSPAIRVAALSLVAVVFAVVLYRLVLARAFVRLADTSMAVLLEKYSGGFHDSLVTAVELYEVPDHAAAFNPEMLEHTRHEAARQTVGVRLGDVFDPAPLIRKVVAAVLLCGSIAAFGFLASEAMAVYIDRIQLSEVPWPRRTRLVVEGFEPNAAGIRMVKVARGASFDLLVKADNALKDAPPSRVEIRYRLDDGRRGRGDTSRIGEAVPGRDAFQEYAYAFTDVFQSHTFDVIGGDDRIRDLRLEVVDSPEIIGMVLECEYPPYMLRAPRPLNVTGTMQIPLGTQVTLKAKSNKELVAVKILDVDQGKSLVIDLGGAAAPRDEFQHSLGRLDADKLLYFVLKDRDGIETLDRDRYRLSLSVVPDEPPQVAVGLKGIGTAITPSARIPVTGKIADDYGIDRVWFHHHRDADPPGETALNTQPGGANEFPIETALDVRAMALKPKQKFTLQVMAGDRCDLADKPNEGSSQKFLFDVVTPEELRSILEGRELTLRQRFETIYGDMTETRDLMARIDFSPLEVVPSDEPSPGDDEAETADSDAGRKDEAEEATEAPDEGSVRRRKLRIARSLQNVQRSAHEVLNVATAFDEIREELINNRVDTEELLSRLQEGIAAPLRQIGGPMMTELVGQLTTLEGLAADLEAGPSEHARAIVQADAVLVEMKSVLDHMLELEDYNEVLEILRGIIQAQGELIDQTQQRRKQQLRSTLEE